MNGRQLRRDPADGFFQVQILLRVSAVSMAVSGLIMAGTTPLHPDIFNNSVSESVQNTPVWALLHLCVLTAIALSFVGACGLVAVHGNGLGRWGQAALAASFIGAVGGSAVMGLEAVAFPVLASRDPDLLALDGPLFNTPTMIGVGILLLGWPVGLTILGVASVRARVFPRGAGLLLVIGAVAFVALEGLFLPVWGVVAGLVLGAAQGWWGWLLWSSASMTASAAPEARPRV